MAQAQPTLDSFIKNNRKFIKIKDGESFRAIYRGYKLITSMAFGEEKDVVVYLLQEKGVDHPIGWQNGSISVAEQMKRFSAGEEIVIKRTGSTAKDTKYEILSADALED
jgi:hypothetical protein